MNLIVIPLGLGIVAVAVWIALQFLASSTAPPTAPPQQQPPQRCGRLGETVCAKGLCHDPFVAGIDLFCHKGCGSALNEPCCLHHEGYPSSLGGCDPQVNDPNAYGRPLACWRKGEYAGRCAPCELIPPGVPGTSCDDGYGCGMSSSCTVGKAPLSLCTAGFNRAYCCTPADCAYSTPKGVCTRDEDGKMSHCGAGSLRSLRKG